MATTFADEKRIGELEKRIGELEKDIIK